MVDMLRSVELNGSIINVDDYDSNLLFLEILKLQRFDLLKSNNIKLHIDDSESSYSLIEYIYSDEDILWEIGRCGYKFDLEEKEKIGNIVLEKYSDNGYQFDNFLRTFFMEKEEFDFFIKKHKDFFLEYIKKYGDRAGSFILENDTIVELLLNNNYLEYLKNISKYSIHNLKLLILKSEGNIVVPYYQGNDELVNKLFNNKEEFTSYEFCTLLSLLLEKVYYCRSYSRSKKFDDHVKDNMDYLVTVVTESGILPKCLIESKEFRDYCISIKRFDLAVKCLLPDEILNNQELIESYCKELNIELKDFYERQKWLIAYCKKNDNLFNSFLGTSLKDLIFSIKEEHYERFINDIEFQMSIDKLSDKEKIIFSKLIENYNYKDYDISLMVSNIVNNIGDYKELIESLDVDSLSNNDIRQLIALLQLPSNQYKITTLDSLRNYQGMKKEYFINNLNIGDIETSKNNLFKYLFNINLEEAMYINSKYCMNNDDEEILEDLENSELPKNVYNYMVLVNKILKCNDISELSVLYIQLKDSISYNLEIPFEAYLRGIYTSLYSESLYRIEEKNQVFGPKDNIMEKVNYNGKEVQVCIPRVNFNFFVHCIGSCSLSSDVIDKNYSVDWLDRPQLQDHFVACSYINEKGIYSIRSEGAVILGFDSLENGSVMGMGNCDIDSIGRYANSYTGARVLQEGNGNRARFFVPTMMLRTINEGYNEIVVERRNTDKSKGEQFKRKPDYIIMMAESMDKNNFMLLDDVIKNMMTFLNEDDIEEIRKLGSYSDIKKYLAKYKDTIKTISLELDMSLNDLANMYTNLIMRSKYYEDSLKASSEFGIPLVVVDKSFYFAKLLGESGLYDEEECKRILEAYNNGSEGLKRNLFNAVANGRNLEKILNPDRSNFMISL